MVRRYWGPGAGMPRTAIIPYSDLAEAYRNRPKPQRTAIPEWSGAVRKRRAWVKRLNVWTRFCDGFLAAYCPGRPGGIGP